MAAGYFSGREVTERESLADTLSILSPAEAPLLRTLPSRTMNRRIEEWSVDTYEIDRAPSNPHANTRLESSDFTLLPADSADGIYPTRLRAIAEINHFGLRVSDSDREAIVAGISNTFDYRAHKTYVRLLNNIETVLMFGTGGTETSGESPTTRKAQGLLYWTAWGGQERMHGPGTGSPIADPYGISLKQELWPTFFDAAGSNLTKSMLYNRILATAARNGFLVPGAIFHVGFKLKNLIADFGVNAAGNNVNERTMAASELGFFDSVDWIRTPLGIVGFRTNRYLDIEGSTVTINGTSGPAPTGHVSRTYAADEIMLGMMAGGYVSVGWYREPYWKQIPTSGDYSALGCVAEYSLVVRNPIALCGGGNLLS